MKLFEKIKDLFTDVDEIEEEKEIEIEETPKERKLPTIMRVEKEQETKKDELKEDKSSIISDRDLINENKSNNESNFRFPISFETKDFIDEKMYSSQNVIARREQPKRTSESTSTFNTPKVRKEEKITLFKASPVISPVYGILDKNYTKEEVQAKDQASYEINRNSTSKKVDFESVRKKAFGSLADDIKDNLTGIKNSKNNVKEEDNKDLLYNLTTDVKEITVGDAEDNYFDFGVAYENAKKDSNKKLNDAEEPSVKIVNYDNEKTKVEKVEVTEPIFDKKKQDDDFTVNEVNSEKNDNLELSDDIFNLIDNMYQEKGENEND